jgi:hypothetical protein
MTAAVLLAGGSAILSVAAVAVSLFAIWRTSALAHCSHERSEARIAEFDATVAELQKTLGEQAAQLTDLRQQGPAGASTAIPRAALNLGKRSQALRMHRMGDPPERIATALGVPLQEIDLLVKVHRIVLGTL